MKFQTEDIYTGIIDCDVVPNNYDEDNMLVMRDNFTDQKLMSHTRETAEHMAMVLMFYAKTGELPNQESKQDQKLDQESDTQEAKGHE